MSKKELNFVLKYNPYGNKFRFVSADFMRNKSAQKNRTKSGNLICPKCKVRTKLYKRLMDIKILIILG